MNFNTAMTSFDTFSFIMWIWVGLLAGLFWLMFKEVYSVRQFIIAFIGLTFILGLTALVMISLLNISLGEIVEWLGFAIGFTMSTIVIVALRRNTRTSR